MKLWHRATGALKDHNSLFLSSISRTSPHRNPDLEVDIIKATSHDHLRVDYKSTQKVFSWIRSSPHNLKPLAWALTLRMNKTRCWVVALKGLMLMHGIFYCKILAIDKIGRLPFDLSKFRDRNSKYGGKTWAYDAFIRAYFTFLDQRSALLCKDLEGDSMEVQLTKLHKMQNLLDLLIEVKPRGMHIPSLILEAMDCIIVEIFDVYSRICKGIARVLMRIYSAKKSEAETALKIVKRASRQAEEFAKFFELCKDIGAINRFDCPRVERIPEEDIQDLERIINGVSNSATIHEKAIVVVKDSEKDEKKRGLKTIITDKWEVFDESEMVEVKKKVVKSEDPFAELLSLTVVPTPEQGGARYEHIPDLITF